MSLESDRHARVKEIFLELCEQPRSEWGVALAQLAGDDPEVHADVSELLAADERSRDWSPPVSPSFAEETERPKSEHAEELPDKIASYAIERRLGEGGMGVVYEGRQSKPQRRVAVKVLRRSLATPPLRRRFELEAEVLGQLQHDGIAQIYEAGSDDDGTPFIAMELVDGVPLTDHLKQSKLTTKERVELLARVIDAVDHAHRRGVLHRDIKPSNVLVTPDRSVKVLDFGVARALDASPDATAHTESGQLVGTLPYMSPEQASGKPDSVEVRSDVYSLGVLAYEALAGVLPYPVHGAGLIEAVRLIRTAEPEPLSNHARECRGDLETVIAKALAKDPDQRYASAAEFAADLRRTLADEPIVARPPSAIYQLQKFARRHRALFVGLCIAVTALLVSAISITFALKQALEANEVALREKEEAERQARIAAEVNAFLNDDLLAAAADPQTWGNREMHLSDALDIAAERLDGRFLDEPLIEAQIRRTLGGGYLKLSRFDKAEAQLTRAAALFEEHLPSSEYVHNTFNLLGQVYSRSGRVAEALAAFLDNEERIRKQGGEIPIAYRHNLATAYRAAGYAERAVLIYEEAVADAIDRWGKKSEQAQVARMSYATGLTSLKRREEALEILGPVVDERLEDWGQSDPRTCVAQCNYAWILMELGRYADATPILEAARDPLVDRLSARHAHSITVANNLVRCYTKLKRYEEAEPLARENLAIASQNPGSRDEAQSQHELAQLLLATDRAAAAVPHVEAALATRRRLYGDRHRTTLAALGTLGIAKEKLKELDAAHAIYMEWTTVLTEVVGATDKRTLSALDRLADLHSDRREYVAEVPLREELVETHRDAGSPMGKQIRTRLDLAIAYRRVKLYEAAKPILLELIPAFTESEGTTHITTRRSLRELARVHEGLGDLEEATLVQRKLLAANRLARPTNDISLWRVMRATAAYEDAIGEHDRAAALLDEELGYWQQCTKFRDPSRLAAIRSIARLHGEHGRFRKAEMLLNTAIPYEGKEGLRGRAELVRLRNAEKRYREAVVLGKKVYQEFVDLSGPGKSSRTVAKFLATAYEGLGNTEEAARWRELGKPPKKSSQPAHD